MAFLVDNIPNLKRHGAYYVGPCPMCGGRDRFTVKLFQDGREGWLCRHCSGEDGYSTPEHYLVTRYGVSYRQAREMIASGSPDQFTPRAAQPAREPEETQPKKASWWQRDGGRFVYEFGTRPDVVTLWQAYKPLSEETIRSAWLGVGVLPASRCTHDRLIVPIFNDAGQVVCFRGRRISCDCVDHHGKLINWTASGGWRLEELPLYNLRGATPGEVVWIVENQVDALMVSELTDFRGVSTTSVSYWRDQWTQELLSVAPSLVVVAYDNDLVGNGGAKSRDALLKKSRDAAGENWQPPACYGSHLALRLQAAGVPAVLYDWKDSPAGDDIGKLLTRWKKDQNEEQR